MAEISRNLLLIALAVRLQRLVKNLPNNHVSAERISRHSLAEAYFADGISPSLEGARKTAGRYMDEMEHIFGLKGCENTGFVMAEKFNTFKDMFIFWLERIDPPSRHDKRLSVMVQGIIHAIDNAFTEDPIVIPKLAKQLKDKYGNKNIRDTREPLQELFDSYYIASWLQLIEMDEEGLAVSTDMDPLLLRLKSRSTTGSNADRSIKLARPGRIHVVFDSTVADLCPSKLKHCKAIARAVAASEIWEINKQDYLPYVLQREGQQGSIILTMRNLNEQRFENIHIDQLSKIYTSQATYRPFSVDISTWDSFKQLVR